MSPISLLSKSGSLSSEFFFGSWPGFFLGEVLYSLAFILPLGEVVLPCFSPGDLNSVLNGNSSILKFFLASSFITLG